MRWLDLTKVHAVIAQAKLIGDAHASVAAQDGSFDGSRACSVM
jgi:hypothetical protein